MSSGESDIELSSALTNKPKTSTKRPPKSPTEGMLSSEEPKKVSTKVMVHKALTDLKTRKGVSMYAIKKYIQETYKVDTEKNSKYIKKCIKAAVEMGTIIQTKGVGASGSFRLAAVKEKVAKKKDPVKIPQETSAKLKKIEKMAAKKKGTEEIIKKIKNKEMSKKVTAKKDDNKKMPTKSKEMKTKEAEKLKPSKPAKETEPKLKSRKTKTAKVGGKTPTKTIGIMKRRSIGSIIKKPKMKPTKREA